MTSVIDFNLHGEATWHAPEPSEDDAPDTK